ncbi:hypothetical protein V6N11_054202 [Hibiscus sabdariffa]|uniref:Uncharacterized protein n=1 Tax=Hibiscus sabdariffa TaxID=183260 RepID=A0ABR2S359_9ROSI
MKVELEALETKWAEYEAKAEAADKEEKTAQKLQLLSRNSKSKPATLISIVDCFFTGDVFFKGITTFSCVFLRSEYLAFLLNMVRLQFSTKSFASCLLAGVSSSNFDRDMMTLPTPFFFNSSLLSYELKSTGKKQIKKFEIES